VSVFGNATLFWFRLFSEREERRAAAADVVIPGQKKINVLKK